MRDKTSLVSVCLLLAGCLLIVATSVQSTKWISTHLDWIYEYSLSLSYTDGTVRNPQVPLFINQGDTLKIDTRTGGYVERV